MLQRSVAHFDPSKGTYCISSCNKLHPKTTNLLSNHTVSQNEPQEPSSEEYLVVWKSLLLSASWQIPSQQS